MTDDEIFDYESYTVDDLYRDMEILRKAGIIDIEGMTDDGQWLYGLTEEGKALLKDANSNDLDLLASVFEKIARIEEEGE